jgi:hypothetical protein
MQQVPPDRRGRARHRGFHALWVALVIGAGLASRSEALALSPFVAKYAGDALWGLMIFLGLGLVWPARRTTTLAALAAAVCVAVECSQLYRAPWLDAARRTWAGRMMLGNTFGWGDIAAYLVGIAAGGLAEWAAGRALHRPGRPTPSSG